MRAVQLGGPFPGRLVVAALADEEGLMLGAKHFARTWRELLPGEIDGVIVCEPEDGEVCATAKGAVRLTIELTGVMAHGAMPQHGRNPIPVAAAGRSSHWPTSSAGWPRSTPPHEHLGPPYLTPTVLLAGDQRPGQRDPGERGAVRRRAHHPRRRPRPGRRGGHRRCPRRSPRPADVGVRVEVVDDRPPVDTPLDHPVVRRRWPPRTRR